MESYIYKFYNELEEVIYIGITKNIKGRITQQHFTKRGHLSIECYNEVFYVLYSKCFSYDDAKVKERYLINKLSPKFNVTMNNQSKFGFEIDDFNWKYIPINKQKINSDNNFNKKHLVKVNKNIINNFKIIEDLTITQTRIITKILELSSTTLDLNLIVPDISIFRSCAKRDDDKAKIKNIILEIYGKTNLFEYITIENNTLYVTYKRYDCQKNIYIDNRIYNFRYKYSMPLYFLYLFNKNKDIEINYLKTKLNINNYYNNYNSLKTRVLEAFIKDMKESLQINISLEETKQANKVKCVKLITNS